ELFPPLYRLPNSFCLDTEVRNRFTLSAFPRSKLCLEARRFAYWTLDLRPKRDHKFSLDRNPLCCSDHAEAGGTMLKKKITLPEMRWNGLRMPCRSSPNQLSRSPRINCSTQRYASSSVICTGGCLEKYAEGECEPPPIPPSSASLQQQIASVAEAAEFGESLTDSCKSISIGTSAKRRASARMNAILLASCHGT